MFVCTVLFKLIFVFVALLTDDCLSLEWKKISAEASEYESIETELIYGTVPSAIRGIVYKNGVGRVKLSDDLFYDHWFDGDGMATSLIFTGNGSLPSYTAKYIKTTRYMTQSNERQYFKTRGAWTQATNWYHNVFHQPQQPSNTNILHFNNKLFSLCEGGKPIQINKYTLNTLNNDYTFNDQLSSFFSAHSKTYFNQELESNVLINIGIAINPPSTQFNLHIFSITEDEESFLNENIIRSPYNALMHDFMITEKFIILLFSPYIMSSANILKSILLGSDSLGNYQQWIPSQGSWIYILDKYSLDVISYQQIEAISYFHWITAYDEHIDDDDIYLIKSKLVRFPTATRSELEFKLKNLFKVHNTTIEPNLFGGISEINLKLDLKMKKIINIDIVNDVDKQSKYYEPFELPEINNKYLTSSKLRYIYTNSISSTTKKGYFLDSLQKIDLMQQESQIYSDIEKNIYLTSPLFIEKQNSKKQDDGYVIVYGFDVNNNISLIYIFDANDISSPLTILSLNDINIPIFFHGTYLDLN